MLHVRNPERGQILIAGPCQECGAHMPRGAEAWDIMDGEGFAIADTFCSIVCLNKWSSANPGAK